jgi:hypothetical protein
MIRSSFRFTIHRNDDETGILNHPKTGPWFGDIDLSISSDCHQNEFSYSRLGCSYGTVPDLNQYALFGQEDFRVVDYEVFKIVIE